MQFKNLKSFKIGFSFLGVLSLIGCIQVPHPFEKNKTTSLTTPPPSRLIVPPPSNSMLNDKNAQGFAEEMAKAMLEQTVPAVARPAQKGDWILLTKVRSEEDMIIPSFTIIAPNGKVEAVRKGMPVSKKDWISGQQSIFHDVSEQSAPIINQVLTGLQARQMAADPHSLKHRAAKIYFKGVFGAPGDGNKIIAQQFAISFADKANAIQYKPDQADYTVDCHVSVTDGAQGTRGNPVQHVEIIWRVTDNKGKEAGKVSQINDVPAHRLDHYWGDIGSAVGEEAAGGVRQVITNYSGRDNQPLPANNAKESASSNAPELKNIQMQHK